ncbi:MAG TPA: SUF system Fe-S cluster assembly protein [Bacteroidia bacterium]|nr:SUF system Fe-S cluster assembly protein [Bacteroidia bacterium]
MPATIIAKNAELAQKIIDAIKTCYDPEIPVDIWELGLIYGIDVSDDNEVKILMTLTSPNCPAAESLPPDVENKVRDVEGVRAATVEVTFDPPWEKDMMSEVAQLELGFM